MLSDKERESAKLHYEAICRAGKDKVEEAQPHWDAIVAMACPDNTQELLDLRLVVVLELVQEVREAYGLPEKEYVAIVEDKVITVGKMKHQA